MLVSELFGIHKNQTIYIVGTGPSLKAFPLDFLSDKLTIGLNNSYKMLETTYNITIHPELIEKKDNRKWVTKRKGKNIRWPSSWCYWFFNNKDVHCYDNLFTEDDTLYVGRGIHTGAISLAAKMGAKYIVLVGCDMNSILGHHHAKKQDVQFHGLAEEDVYQEYFVNTCEMQLKLFPIEIFSMSPFFGLGHHETHFQWLTEFEKPPKTKDTSTYKRSKSDFS